MELSEIIGRNIKTYLSYVGKEQKELAKYVGVVPSAVCSWVNGDRSPRFERIDKICEFLHCEREDLIREEVITFTEFKNRSAKKELIDIVSAMNDADVRATLAFVRTLGGINAGNSN